MHCRIETGRSEQFRIFAVLIYYRFHLAWLVASASAPGGGSLLLCLTAVYFRLALWNLLFIGGVEQYFRTVSLVSLATTSAAHR